MTNFFQKIIDIIRYKYYYKPHFIKNCYKFYGIENNINNIKTLVLGSSHAEYAFLPDETGDYNLGLTSQDLYYSYMLYKKYSDKLPKLKNIILFYSVFSPGFELEKSNLKFLCVPYVYNFKILSKTFSRNIKLMIECLYRSIMFYYYDKEVKNTICLTYQGEPKLQEKPYNPIGGG